MCDVLIMRTYTVNYTYNYIDKIYNVRHILLTILILVMCDVFVMHTYTDNYTYNYIDKIYNVMHILLTILILVMS